MLQEAVEGLQARKVRPMANGLYVAILSPRQIQHLKSDTSVTGWRQAAIQADETNENSVFRGQVNIYEGCYIIMNNKLGPNDKGFVLGAEALAKVFPDAPGFGPQPRTVVSPVTDKLRRFASVGWYHMVGYSIFRPEAVVHLTASPLLRPRPTP
jgi:hypothetical protein